MISMTVTEVQRAMGAFFSTAGITGKGARLLGPPRAAIFLYEQNPHQQGMFSTHRNSYCIVLHDYVNVPVRILDVYKIYILCFHICIPKLTQTRNFEDSFL